MDCDFSCEEFNNYRVNEPYPKVTLAAPNQRYGKIVSDGYAGRGSETTAIMQYEVHRLCLPERPDLLRAYKYIAITEMTHWELLGNLVRQLGLSPRLIAYDTCTYWSGAFPASACTLDEILLTDIDGEYDAIAHYNRMIREISEPQIQALFQRIILDEEKHIEILTRLYQKYQ